MSADPSGVSRRHLLMAALAGAAVLGPAGSRQALAQGAGIDFDVLNFALNLEYAEAEFYTHAVSGKGIESLGIETSGVGKTGATTGGREVFFQDPVVKEVAQELAYDEQMHVIFLRSLLGSYAIAKPPINLMGMGIGFRNDEEFLTVGRAMEDTGVSAYAGAAPLLRSQEIIGIAAQILSDEAYHMGNVRLLLAQKNWPVKPTDAKDIPPPPMGPRLFTLDEKGMSLTRTPAEVIRIARPFFPQGINGRIQG